MNQIRRSCLLFNLIDRECFISVLNHGTKGILFAELFYSAISFFSGVFLSVPLIRLYHHVLRILPLNVVLQQLSRDEEGN